MILYKALQTINDMFEVKDNMLYEFLLNSCADYGSFLRTQFCKLNKPLIDKDIECKWVIFSVKGAFKVEDACFIGNMPCVAVQVHWATRGLEVKEIVELTKTLGLNDVYVFRVYE